MARTSVPGSEYLRELGEKLAPSIKVFWTGPEIISNKIPIDTIRELAAVLRRRPVIWDNLYANDYDMRRLHMGPYTGRPQALKKEIDGVLLNPNCQCHANFVPVRCLASWLNPTSKISQHAAWNRAVHEWLAEFSVCGSRKVRFDDLCLLCDFFHLPSAPGRKARQFLDDLQALIRKTPLQWGNELSRFRRTCRLVLDLFDTLMRLENRALLHALYAHLWEIKERALLLDAWAAWRKANPSSRTKFAPSDFSPALLRGAVCAQLDQIIRQIVRLRRVAGSTERRARDNSPDC